MRLVWKESNNVYRALYIVEMLINIFSFLLTKKNTFVKTKAKLEFSYQSFQNEHQTQIYFTNIETDK